MSIIEDVRMWKSEGMSDREITDTLRRQGVSDREISDAISEADVKEAVVGEGGMMEQQSGIPVQEVQQPVEASQEMYNYYAGQQVQEQIPSGAYAGMEPSMSVEGQDSGYQEYGGPTPGYGGVAQYPAEQQYNYEQYPQYQQYQEGMSSDVITEIAEQVVVERMSQMREKIEKTLDFKNVAEARIESLDDRLKRMEKIIDTLQLSVLERVGEYVTDVKSLKKELFETQKTVKAVHHHHIKRHHSPAHSGKK